MSAIMRLRRGEPFDVRRVDGADHRACMELVHGVYVASGDWTAATHLGLWTLETGGTFVWGKQLTAPRTVRTGKLFRVAIGGITLSIDPA